MKNNSESFVFTIYIREISWTMSDMVKYKAALWSFLKLTALVFYNL